MSYNFGNLLTTATLSSIGTVGPVGAVTGISNNGVSDKFVTASELKKIEERLKVIEERLCILIPILEDHEKYTTLREAYEQYKVVEALLK